MKLDDFVKIEDSVKLESKSLHTHRHPVHKARKAADQRAAYLHFLTPVGSLAQRRIDTDIMFNGLQNSMRTAFRGLVSKLDKKIITYRNSLNQAQSLFTKFYTRAFQLGMRSVDMSTGQGADPFFAHKHPMTPADHYWIRTAVTAEMKFWERAVKGRGDWRQSPQERVEMYVNTLEAIYKAGQVIGLPEMQAINWQVDHFAENCTSCLWLEQQGPFTKESLPTTPRAGDTRCLYNCKCELVVYTVHPEDYDRLNRKDRKQLQQQLRQI